MRTVNGRSPPVTRCILPSRSARTNWFRRLRSSPELILRFHLPSFTLHRSASLKAAATETIRTETTGSDAELQHTRGFLPGILKGLRELQARVRGPLVR